jgi:hypothetical protein
MVSLYGSMNSEKGGLAYGVGVQWVDGMDGLRFQQAIGAVLAPSLKLR